MDSENNNEKVNVPLFPSPEPTVSCINDLDFYKDFKNEFSAIVYNDALTSKLDFSTKPTLCPQHIDESNLKDETSLSEYDEVEQNVLYFNDLFPFNIIYPDDIKSDKGNNDNEIDMIQSSGGNENIQGLNKLLEGSHDKISKVFIMRSFVMELNVNIVAWIYLVKGMLFNLIKNLYVSFGISFDPKCYYKDGDCTKMLWRPRQVNRVHILDFEGFTPGMRQDLAEKMRMEYTRDDGQEVFVSHNWRRLFGIRVPLVQEFIHEFIRTCRIRDEIWLDVAGLHTAEEMAEDEFGAYWLGRERVIPNKGGLSDYWVEISSGKDFLRGALSYTYIRDPVRRLCHRLISYDIFERGHAPKKVTATDLFYLCSMNRGVANVPYLLAHYLFRHIEGRKNGARLFGGHFIGRLTYHFGLVSDDGLRGLSVVTSKIPLIDMPPPPTPAVGRTMPRDWGDMRRRFKDYVGMLEVCVDL
nr:hypothetical protein [Tanacetum cinerariifolium]